MHRSTVTERGQTTLPKPVRDALGVSPGDRLAYHIDGATVRVVKAQPVMRLAGMLHGERQAVSVADMDAAIEAEAVARVARWRDRT